MNAFMGLEIITKCYPTYITNLGLLLGMNQTLMSVETVYLIKSLSTYITNVRFLSSMNAFMSLEIITKCYPTYITNLGLLLGMNQTLMSVETVYLIKSLSTYITNVRFLSSMNAFMCIEVGALTKSFSA